MTRVLSISGVLLLLLPLQGRQPSHRSSLDDASPSLRSLCALAHANVSAGRHAAAARESRECALQAEASGLPKIAARAWAWLAASELAALRYKSAAQAFLRARDLARRIGDFPVEAAASFNLSNIYLHLGSVEPASAAMESAMRLRDRAGSTLPSVQILFHYARLTSRLRGIDIAIPFFEQSLELARHHRSPSWSPTVEEAYAVELLLAGRLSAAAAHASEAIRLRERKPDAQLGSAYLTLARIALAQDRPEESLTLVAKAFELLKVHKPQRPLYAYFLQRALAHSALGHLEDARSDLRRAAAQIRSIRPAMLPSDAFRIGSSAGYELAFAALAEVNARLYLQTGDRPALVESFEASAENRAQALRAAGSHRDEPVAGYAEALRELQAAELESLRLDTPAAKAKTEAARLRLAELDYMSSPSTQAPLPAAVLDAVQASLAGDAAICHFQLGARQSLAWVITRRSIDVLSLPTAGFLERQIRDFRQKLEAGSPLAAAAGHEIFKTLFGALPKAAQEASVWKIVPDTALFHLPFPALVTGWNGGRPRYLIEDREISLVHFPGANQTVPHAADGRWEAFGDPVYNTSDPRFDRAVEATLQAPSSLRLPRLPGTAREVAACSRLWPGGNARTHFGTDVNIARIQQSLNAKPEVIHFATHLIPAAGDAEQSRLVLSLNRSGEPELLDPATVAALRAPCRLVVMTGCRAGSGTAIASEGLLGLARSWMVAGAEAVAATYWPMPDDSGDLIFSFYRHWRGASTAPSAARASHALRLAQLDMIRSESWRARPSYWASYFVMGKS